MDDRGGDLQVGNRNCAMARMQNTGREGGKRITRGGMGWPCLNLNDL